MPRKVTAKHMVKWRARCGLTQQEAGRVTGYSRNSISKMEIGMRNISPRVALLMYYVEEHGPPPDPLNWPPK